MDQFIDVNTFATLAGCITITVAITQIAKQYFVNTPTKLINLVAALIVTTCAVYFKHDYSLDGIILGMLNIIPIMMGATGAYEYAVKPLVHREDKK